ncbi:MAG: hypothetical protein K6E56_04545 [Lachnospiraceae bacterium]|nr:hypothetical protein [Lachnospiraceae bacterium]
MGKTDTTEVKKEQDSTWSQAKIDTAIYESNKEVLKRTPVETKSREGKLGKAVRLNVNGTTIESRENDDVSVPPIHLFPGVTLDMGAAGASVGKIDDSGNVTLTDKVGARLIISVSGVTQVIEVAAKNVEITGQNGSSETTVSGDLDGYLAFMLGDYSTIFAKGASFTNDYVASTTDGEHVSPDGTTSKLGQIMIIKGGVYANSVKLDELTFEDAKEEEPEENNTIEVSSDSPLGAAKDIAKSILNGTLSKQNIKGGLKGNIINSDEEDTKESIPEAVKEGIKDQAISAGTEAAKALLTGDNILKAAGGDVATNLKMKAFEAKEDIDDMVKSLRDLDFLPDPLLDAIQNAFTSADKTADKLVGVTDAEESVKDAMIEKEQEEEDKLEFSLKIIPGLLSLTFSVEPHIDLSAGLDFNIESPDNDEYRRMMHFALSAMGSIGLALSGELELGNCLLALTGGVTVDGSLVGGMDSDNTFLKLKGIDIETVKRENGINASLNNSATLNLAVNLDFTLGGAIEAGSTILGWKKTLVSGEVKTTAASVALQGDVTHTGHLMSLSGWSIKNTDITTALFDESKTKASEMQFAEVNNIAGVNDFLSEQVDRGSRIEMLNSAFEKINAETEKADAMVFSNEPDSYNKKLAGQFDLLKRAYDAVIELSEEDIGSMDAQIEKYEEESKDEIAAVDAAINKRNDRRKLLDTWADENAERLDNKTVSKDELLDFYRKEGGAGGGYARTDKEKRNEQALNEIYTKENLMKYENLRIDAKREERRTGLEEITALKSKMKIKDLNAPNEKFLKEYISLKGSGKGFVNHLLRKGVSTGIFTEDELKQRLLTYEQRRLDEKVSAKTEISSVLDKHKELAPNTVSTQFNKDLRDADNEMWQKYVMSSMSSKNILDYEKNRVGEAFWTEHKKSLSSVMISLKEKKLDFEAEKDETQKKNKLNEARTSFLGVLDNDEIKMLSDNSKAYMMMSAEQIRDKIEKLSNLDYYLDNVNKNLGKDINVLRQGDDEKAVKSAIENEENKDIYKKYIDYLYKNNMFKNDIFSIRDMIDYEKKRGKELKEEKADSKHTERVSFLTYESKRIELLKDTEKFGGFDEKDNSENEKQKALLMYFTGERPSDYLRNTLKKPGFEAKKAEEFIKILKSKEPSKETMLEALEWNASEQEDYQKFVKGKQGVEGTELTGAAALFEQWQGKVDPESALNVFANRVAKSGMNTGLNAVAPNEYSFDGMISFLQFMLGDQKHVERIEKLERLIAENRDEESIKKFYVEKLAGGNGFAEAMAESESSGLTPKMAKEYYGAFAGEELNSRNQKHNERVKRISTATDFDELVKWYTVAQNGSRFEELLLEDKDVRKRITPSVIIEYEKQKVIIGSNRHNERLNAIKESDSDESARDVYEKMFNGGAGFLRNRKEQINTRAENIARERDANAELEQIYAYEAERLKKWEELKEKYMKPINELNNRKAELTAIIEASREKIADINNNLDVLRTGTDDLAKAKDAVKAAGDKVKQADEGEALFAELEDRDKENKEFIKANEDTLSSLMEEIAEDSAELQQLDALETAWEGDGGVSV